MSLLLSDVLWWLQCSWLIAMLEFCFHTRGWFTTKMLLKRLSFPYKSYDVLQVLRLSSFSSWQNHAFLHNTSWVSKALVPVVCWKVISWSLGISSFFSWSCWAQVDSGFLCTSSPSWILKSYSTGRSITFSWLPLNGVSASSTYEIA